MEDICPKCGAFLNGVEDNGAIEWKCAACDYTETEITEDFEDEQ